MLVSASWYSTNAACVRHGRKFRVQAVPRGHAVDQSGGDFGIRPRLAAADGAGGGVGDARAALVQADLLLLQRRGLGKHEIRPGRRRCQILSCHNKQIERAQRGDSAIEVGIGQQDIGPAGIQCPYRIGLAGQDRRDDRRIVTRHLIAQRPGPQWIRAGPDPFRLNLGGQPEGRIKQYRKVRLEPRRLFHPPVAADAVHIAGDRNEGEIRAERLHARTGGIDPVAGHEAGRALGIPTRSPHDVVRRHPGCLLRPCRRAWCHMLRQRLEAVAPPIYEVGLVAVLHDQRTDHRQRQRRIGGRPWAQPQVGDLRRRRAERIDHDDPRAALLRTLQRHPLNGIRHRRIAPCYQGTGGMVDILAARDGKARHLVRHRPAAAA